MSAMLLPDDPAVADRIVQLINDKHAALMMLRRMREERDQWRNAYEQLAMGARECAGCSETAITMNGSHVRHCHCEVTP